MPLTNERVLVQVKSAADLDELVTYKETFRKDMKGYSRFFFVVHSPKASLEGYEEGETGFNYIGPTALARLVVDYGLAEWVISKVS
jgi:hypothetical protein